LNSYTFHINLYDLAALGTIFVGITFSLLFALSGGLMIMIALLTMSLQIMKAALVSPVKSLRGVLSAFWLSVGD
jgi:hypothetical protein